MTDKIRAALVAHIDMASDLVGPSEFLSKAEEALREYDARATPALPEGMAIVPVERITTVARDVEYSPHTNRHTPFLRINFSYDDYDSRDAIYTMLAAAKEPATCSVCGLKRSDTKNCKAPDCSPMLAAAKEQAS